jgi:hypothetical protein
MQRTGNTLPRCEDFGFLGLVHQYIIMIPILLCRNIFHFLSYFLFSVSYIRKKFPSPDGKYVGFKSKKARVYRPMKKRS